MKLPHVQLKCTWLVGVCTLAIIGALQFWWRPVVVLDVRGNSIYILTRSYGGQLTRAIRNLMVQQCWAGSAFDHGTNIFIVEPFSKNSELIHNPEIWSELDAGKVRTAARFSDYYNLKYYNIKSVESGNAEIISWEDFTLQLPRTAVAITIPLYGCSSKRQYRMCFHSKKFIHFVQYASNNGIDKVHYFCVSCSSNIQLDLKELLYQHIRKEGSLLIFINTWRNYAFTKSWLQIPFACKSVEYMNSSDRLLPSNEILNQTRIYQMRYAQGKFRVAVMLRIERFLTLILSRRSNTTVDACLKEVLLLHDKLYNDGSINTFVTMDIGRYGSSKMQKDNQYFEDDSVHSIDNITKAVEVFVSHLHHGYKTLSDWEETFLSVTSGIVERGYIASLQRTIASKADCLILMGGGSFQEVAGFQYLDYHRNHSTCVYTICTSNQFKLLFSGQPIST